MVSKNSILFSIIDREDGWVSSALCLECDQSLNYEDAYKSLKEKLESPEVVQYVIDDYCLECDLFDAYFDHEEDHPEFKFKKTYWKHGLIYVFETEDEDVVEHKFTQTNFICTIK